MRAGEIKFAVLDMISSTRSAPAELIQSLSAEEWEFLDRIARQHRLMPMLHHRHRSAEGRWPVPSTIAKAWSDAYRRSAIRSLSARQTLLHVHNILAQSGIPYAALKGAWLAWHAYAHPALRPMRDIDILVAPERALDAYAALMEAGFTRNSRNQESPDEALVRHRHLPPLWNPAGNVSLEVHSRLIEHLEIEGSEAIGDLLDRRIFVAGPDGEEIAFLSPADALLHLIIHSAYDHRFNNGPLVMNDVALLLAATDIDWERFWRMAGANRWSRGCRLVFEMTGLYHGDLPAEARAGYPDHVPDRLIADAALLTLQDMEGRKNIGLWTKLKAANTASELAAMLKSRLLPPPHALAAFAHDQPGRRAPFLVYPAWLANRAISVARDFGSKRLRDEAVRTAGIEGWLTER